MKTNTQNFITTAAEAIQRLFVGRINRMQFLVAHVLLSLVVLIYVLLLIIVGFYVGGWPLSKTQFMLPILAASLFFCGAYVRRLHDMGVSGWLGFIPLIGHVLIIASFFWPGKKEANKYGEMPKKRSIVAMLGNTYATERDTGEILIGTIFTIILIICAVLALFSV